MSAAATTTTAVQLTVETPAQMQDLGRRLAAVLRAGDLVLLTGALGAGKTTLARGLGDGLGVRGAVTSPTFVIARVHPSVSGGPPLVHVDAYRLGGGLEEMEDLDLDVSLPESVVVVEWGEGKVEELAEDRLHVVIERRTGGALGSEAAADAHETDEADDADEAEDADDTDEAEDAGDADVRHVTLAGVGDRWAHGALAALARA